MWTGWLAAEILQWKGEGKYGKQGRTISQEAV